MNRTYEVELGIHEGDNTIILEVEESSAAEAAKTAKLLLMQSVRVLDVRSQSGN